MRQLKEGKGRFPEVIEKKLFCVTFFKVRRCEGQCRWRLTRQSRKHVTYPHAQLPVQSRIISSRSCRKQHVSECLNTLHFTNSSSISVRVVISIKNSTESSALCNVS
jgi:hypothetical protein